MQSLKIEPKNEMAWLWLSKTMVEPHKKLQCLERALKLNPTSAIAMIEYANGMVMLEGERRLPEATRLYQAAAATEPLDAAERLDVEMAKAELED